MNLLSIIRDNWAGPMPRPILFFLATLFLGSVLGALTRHALGVPVPNTAAYYVGQVVGSIVVTGFAYWLKHRYPPQNG